MLDELKNEFASLVPVPLIETDYRFKGYHLDVEVGPDQVVAAAELLDRRGFFLEAITGVDWLGKAPLSNQPEVEAGEAGEGGGAGKAEAATAPPTDKMEVVYDYNRTVGELCRVAVRCRLDRANPELPTVSRLIPGANWHERETHDFFGIIFSGHPDLSPLLLPEDADFHPLRKDFKA
ncbi:MAG: NADH-quinone oxidoreductase subunit C [Desulfobulbales bacterium]|nr:NADH-quinone oxidoreductase subunit C [Desulfobulbales bacterium]